MTTTIKRALYGAVFAAICSIAQADTVPLTITLPFPDASPPARALPVLPVVQPVSPALPARSAGAPIETIAHQANVSAFGFACDTALKVHPRPEAVLSVTLSAPCRPGQIVRITHVGLEFDIRLPQTGEMTFDMPALDAPSRVTAHFPGGSQFSTTADPGVLDDFLRVAMQSDASAGLAVGTSSSKRLPVTKTELGDGSGQMVQIVSHHLSPQERRGVIRLALLSKVTAAHCDQPSDAKVIERRPGLPVRQYGLSLSAPGCARVGEILELKNILQDLKLAQH